MSTIAAYGRKLQSIRHPLTRSDRPSRPFGEGLDKPRPVVLTIRGVRYQAEPFTGQDGTAVVRLVKQARDGAVYDVSRSASDGLVRCTCPDYEFSKAGTASPCKHGAACVEAGLIAAPAPVANIGQTNRVGHLLPTDRPAVAKVEPVAEVAPVASAPVVVEAPTIPASVKRIRVVNGGSAGVWVRQPKRNRWVWSEDAADLDFSDTSRWLAYSVADAWYRDGRVAILSDVGTTVPAPAPRMTLPTLDEVWHSAYQLARAGVDALPCKTWTDAAKLAFLDGFYWGALQRDVDMEDDSDRYTDADEPSWPFEVGMV